MAHRKNAYLLIYYTNFSLFNYNWQKVFFLWVLCQTKSKAHLSFVPMLVRDVVPCISLLPQRQPPLSSYPHRQIRAGSESLAL